MTLDDEPRVLMALLALAAMLYIVAWLADRPRAEELPSGAALQAAAVPEETF
jgi:hypothetical protein